MDTHLPIPPRGRDRRSLARLPVVGLLLAVLLVVAPAASASSLTDNEVLDTLEVEGRVIEPASNRTVESAADRANGAGIAFAWLDRSGDDGLAIDLADAYVEDLGARGSRYQTVLVVVGNGFAASSLSRSQIDLDEALDAALAGFADGDMARGLDAFVTTMAASGGASTDTSGSPTTVPSDSGTSDSGGGIGFGTILLLVAIVGGGFLLVRRMLRGRRDRAKAEIDLAEDRAEIEEQLKNNADRVIALGDRVIAKGDRELIVLYEEASATYQDVSQRIDEAETAAEIDELDDRIDHAEWQFEVIEASLDGRPRPRPPVPDDVLDGDPSGGPDDLDDRAAAPAGTGRGLPPPPQSPSSRGQPPVVTSPRTGRSYPRSTGRRRRRGGGLGGVLGGGLGGVLADIVLGGGLGGLGGTSRRTRRRSSTRGGIDTGRGGGLGGGLGGGVLRRGGGSTGRPRSRRSSGGRSIGGRSRSRGGRRI